MWAKKKKKKSWEEKIDSQREGRDTATHKRKKRGGEGGKGRGVQIG